MTIKSKNNLGLKLAYRKIKPKILRDFFKLRNKKIVHFLHIGKTGGTALRSTFKAFLDEPIESHCFTTQTHAVYFHGHEAVLRDIPEGEKVFFFLRDPISRFISGFYEIRKRELPQYQKSLNAEEKAEQEVFQLFPNANDLALGLSSSDQSIRTAAIDGMNTIGHLCSYMKWFDSSDYFLSRFSDVLFIGFQETLDNDFILLQKVLNLPSSAKLPDNNSKANKMPTQYSRNLDSVAIQNLMQWYEQDYLFLSLCREKATAIKHSLG